MKRVLIVTYYWPPSGGSGVQRWLKMAKYLPQFGWEPVIYTPLNPEVNTIDESLCNDISPDLKVIKRKIREPYGIYKFLTGRSKGERLPANMIGDSNGGNASRSSGSQEGHRGKKTEKWPERLAKRIRANWFIPDPRCWWIKPSVKYLSRLMTESSPNSGFNKQTETCSESRSKDALAFDAIVSTGPPHSMHLIAKELHKKFNIPWIADFRDPWTGIFYFKHLGLSKKSLKKHREFEKSVLEEADRVVVVSSQMEKDFSEDEYSHLKDKIAVIPNGYDPADFSEESNPDLIAAKKVVESLSGKKQIFTEDTNKPDENVDSAKDRIGSNESAELAKDCGKSDENAGLAKDSGKSDETAGLAKDCGKSDENGYVAGRFVVAHTGLMPQSADPDKFWKVLGNLVKEDGVLKERLLIVTVGQTDSCVKKEIAEQGLNENFIDIGQVNHTTSIAWQKRADLLLLPLRKEAESKAILTGKFFEYLASGNPILAFGPTNGDLAKELEETDSGTICGFEDGEGMKKAFLDVWNGFKTREMQCVQDKSDNPKRLKFSRIKTAEEYASLLETVVTQQSEKTEPITE